MAIIGIRVCARVVLSFWRFWPSREFAPCVIHNSGKDCFDIQVAIAIVIRMQGPTRLRAWRESMGINGTEAAQAMGVSQSCYWDWEAGKKSPRISHALNIARVTDGLVPVEVWNDES